MKASEYREKFEKELAEGANKKTRLQGFLAEVSPKKKRTGGFGMVEDNTRAHETDLNAALKIVADPNRETDIRAGALAEVMAQPERSEDLVDIVYRILGNIEEPLELRLAALQAALTLQFDADVFTTRRGEFLEILRTIVGENDSPLRIRAVEELARAKDSYVQELLKEGLVDQDKALIPPETAIRLISYDEHHDIFPILREIAKDSSNIHAKSEAIAALSADPESKDLILDTMLDKDEFRAVRQSSAAALKTLAPEEFEEHAKNIVLDDDDYDDIRATSLTGLDLNSSVGPKRKRSDRNRGFGMAEENGPREDGLTEKIEDLSKGSSGDLQKSAERFLSNRTKNRE